LETGGQPVSSFWDGAWNPAGHAFVTRDVARRPLPPLASLMADGTPMRVADWQSTRGGEDFLLYVWAAR